MSANILQNFCSYNINRMVPELLLISSQATKTLTYALDCSQESLQEGHGKVGKRSAMEAALLLML